MVDKSTWGGPNRGQGRKHVNPNEVTVRITVRLPQSQHDWLERQGNIPDTIRRLIQERIDSESQPQPAE